MDGLRDVGFADNLPSIRAGLRRRGMEKETSSQPVTYKKWTGDRLDVGPQSPSYIGSDPAYSPLSHVSPGSLPATSHLVDIGVHPFDDPNPANPSSGGSPVCRLSSAGPETPMSLGSPSKVQVRGGDRFTVHSTQSMHVPIGHLHMPSQELEQTKSMAEIIQGRKFQHFNDNAMNPIAVSVDTEFVRTSQSDRLPWDREPSHSTAVSSPVPPSPHVNQLKQEAAGGKVVHSPIDIKRTRAAANTEESGDGHYSRLEDVGNEPGGVRTLRAEVARLIAHNKEAQDAIDKAHQQVEEQELHAGTLQKRVKQLETDIQGATDKAAKAEQAATDVQDKLLKAEIDNKAMSDQLELLRHQLSGKEREVRMWQEEMEKEKKKTESYANQIVDVKDTCLALQKELSEAHRKMDSAALGERQIGLEVESLRKEKQQLRDVVEKQESDIVQLRDQQKGLMSEAQDLAKTLQNTQSETVRIDRENLGNKKRANELEYKAAKLEGSLASTRDELNASQLKCVELEGELRMKATEAIGRTYSGMSASGHPHVWQSYSQQSAPNNGIPYDMQPSQTWNPAMHPAQPQYTQLTHQQHDAAGRASPTAQPNGITHTVRQEDACQSKPTTFTYKDDLATTGGVNDERNGVETGVDLKGHYQPLPRHMAAELPAYNQDRPMSGLSRQQSYNPITGMMSIGVVHTDSRQHPLGNGSASHANKNTIQSIPYGRDDTAEDAAAKVKRLDQRLSELTMEKNNLESEFTKMPKHFGRSIHEKRRKEVVETRLEGVSQEISSLRLELKNVKGK